ncbi:hypothetical protein ISCGN_032362 [Ixodes scapularis]
MSAPKKLRMPNFTESQITALVDGYEENKIAIEAKGDDPHDSQAKRQAWERITATLFAVSGIRREVADVKKSGSTDYKSANKIRGTAVRRSQNATGGGPGEPDLTEAEECVIGLLSEDALVGIEGCVEELDTPITEAEAGSEANWPLVVRATAAMILLQRRRHPGREWVRSLLRSRETFGEYHHLVRDTRLKNGQDFFQYFRMTRQREAWEALLWSEVPAPQQQAIRWRKKPRRAKTSLPASNRGGPGPRILGLRAKDED